jgi:XisI protein
MILGREQVVGDPAGGTRRVHGCLIHVDIIDGKFWIQRDGTEQGIANELVHAGVPKDHIVLGFRSAELRKHTEFATA